jgi:flagellar hook-associated protein 3 FlgL
MLVPTDGSIPTKNLLPVSHGLEARMAELSEMQNAVALSRTKVGAFLGKAERQQSVLSDRTAVLEADVGELRDADLQRVITELQSLLLTQDAARQAYSKIGQRSLFDFLR